MKEGGRLLTMVMDKVLAKVAVGTTGLELEALFDHLIKGLGVQSAFKGFEGYPFHLCLGINDMVVHGFPSDKKLLNGDVISVDI